jgi:hypothetical protein
MANPVVDEMIKNLVITRYEGTEMIQDRFLLSAFVRGVMNLYLSKT